MRLLELFAGSRSVGKVGESLGMEVFSSDIEPFLNIDYVTDILDFNAERVPFVPDIIWASPPCTFFSVASIGKHWNIDNTPKTQNAILGVEIVKKTLEIITYFLSVNPNLKFFMENPRGKLRKLDIVKNIPITTVTYCSYGDDRMKPTDIWSNNIFNIYNENGWVPRPICYNGNKNCHHQAAPRGSRTGTQGRIGSYDRSKIPEQLCIDILTSCMK